MFNAFTILICMITVGFAGAGIAILFAQSKIFELRRRLNIKSYQLEISNEEYDELVDKYNRLVNKYNNLLNSKSSNQKKEIIEAVKFAMINSHPDKGICKDNETFIKFRKLYKDVA